MITDQGSKKIHDLFLKTFPRLIYEIDSMSEYGIYYRI